MLDTLHAVAERLAYYLRIPLIWAGQFLHDLHGILHVLDIIHFRPLRPGLLPADHPWLTGLEPSCQTPIWPKNILFRSPKPGAGTDAAGLQEDEAIVTRVGQFLAGMVERSAPTPEIPQGSCRRMPHGINYIHGAVHYGAGCLLFNDFPDAMQHFSDPRFVREVRHFVRVERREVLLIFRQRDYTPCDFAYFVAFLRTILPWFSNSNGPRKRVLWGNPAPYAVVNIITGNWIRDVYRLRRPDGARQVVRPPITPGRYFNQPPYRGTRQTVPWPAKLLAIATYYRIRLRGSRGGLYFVDRRKLEAARLLRLREQGLPDEPIAPL